VKTQLLAYENGLKLTYSCRISKFSGGGPRRTPTYRRGPGRRGREWRGASAGEGREKRGGKNGT